MRGIASDSVAVSPPVGHHATGGSDAPPAPFDLVVEGDYTGLTLTWKQDGQVDGWTVYCDPLDGTDTESFYVPFKRGRQPTYRLGDLGPGDHHVGVVAWHRGCPSQGPDCWTYASVLDCPPHAPRIPVVAFITTTVDTVAASWISHDVAHWQLRLLASDHTVYDQLDVVETPYAVFTGLVADARYGFQVKAVGDDNTASPWCEPSWVRTAAIRSGLASREL